MCQVYRESGLEWAPDCNPQHGPVTELFVMITEDVLCLQSPPKWSGAFMMVVDHKNVQTSNSQTELKVIFRMACVYYG